MLNCRPSSLELMILLRSTSLCKARLDHAGIAVWEMLSVVMGALTSVCQLLSQVRRFGCSTMTFNCEAVRRLD